MLKYSHFYTTCFWEYLSERIKGSEEECLAEEIKKSYNIKRRVLRISPRNDKLAPPDKLEVATSTHNKQQAFLVGSRFSTCTNTSYESKPEKIGYHSFNILQLLGKGSFGEVYLAQLKSNKKVYAMKILSKTMILENNLVRYTYTEKNILSQLKHPFIVSLKFAFQSTGKLFLVQDYCPGGDLGKVLEIEKRFSEDTARIYTAEVLLAIEELHNREIIYRDLKPDNVLLDAEGHAMLTDFGLSKERIKDGDFAQSFCGSVAYLAPEMLQRCGHGKSVDWYLLGVLLYELIVGVPPYFSESKEQLFENIKSGKLLVPYDMSDEALDILTKLLIRNPKYRLGAGPKGSKEIKKHPFFRSINWEDALQRKLCPPKPLINPILTNNSKFEIDLEEGIFDNKDSSKFKRWTFISEQDNSSYQN